MGAFEYKFLTILIIAVIAAGLIVWGAKLLRRAYGRGNVAAEGVGLKVSAGNYGPGAVIFVLGFVLLIFCVTRTFSQTTVTTTNTTVVENRGDSQITTTTTMTTTESANAVMEIVNEEAPPAEDQPPAER